MKLKEFRIARAWKFPGSGSFVFFDDNYIILFFPDFFGMKNFEIEKINSLEKIQWQGTVGFSCWGINCGIRVDDRKFLEGIKKVIPPFHAESHFEKASQVFSLVTAESADFNGFYRNEERIFPFKNFEDSYFESIESKIQVSLAVALPPRKFFLHAGAVAFEGRGIIIPGLSFAGKTTLVKEFIKAGAVYYSDDCAVVDRKGFLYPYSKTLSVREGSSRESKIVKAEDFHARIGEKPVKIGAVLLTPFDKKSGWDAEMIGKGKAVWALAQNLFYPASMTLFPKETLEALGKAADGALLLQGKRGEAAETVEIFKRQFQDYLRAAGEREKG